jgi:transmembrane sensor
MPMHRDADTSNPDIARTAAEWVARRDRGLTPAEDRAFTIWRTKDPRHELELERLAGTWRELDSVKAAPELEAMATTFLNRAQARRRGRRIFHVARLTFAAAAALAVGVFSWNRFSPAETARASGRVTENYRVIASTMERTTLPDGSFAELNGTSRIEVDFTSAERRVRLVEGEAHFVVEQDPDRPFFVTAGTVTVRAVGTAFNVRLESAVVEVLVTEGKVKLEQSGSAATPVPESSFVEASPALIQGQRAVIDLVRVDVPAKVQINEVNPSEMTDALGWQSTRLVFNNTPLDEVIAGFNQYNSHRLTLGDARLRGRTLTGVFRADNLDGFVRLLQASVDVKAAPRTPTETVLLPIR